MFNQQSEGIFGKRGHFWPVLPTLSLNFKGEDLNLEAKWIEVRVRVWHIVVKLAFGYSVGVRLYKRESGK